MEPELSPIFRVLGSNNLKVRETPLWKLYQMYREGEIRFASPWLQRMIQELAWTKTDRPASFLQSMLMGNAKVDTLAFVDVTVVLLALKKKQHNAKGVLKECYQSLIEEVEDHMERGCVVYCIDGQNRIHQVITPFFNNELKVSSAFPVYIQYEIGGPVDLTDMSFSEMPEEVREGIKEETVPTVWAEDGDLKSIIRTLVNKNSGVAWSEWEKLCTANFFTVHYQQNVMDTLYYKNEKKMWNLRPELEALFTSLKSMKNYPAQGWGYEKFINEIFCWMITGILPANVSAGKHSIHKDLFNGSTPTKDSRNLLKRYLRDFHDGIIPKLRGKKKIPLTELQNYLMFRYVLDKRLHEFGIDEGYKISLPKLFTTMFRDWNYKLITDGKLNWHTETIGGKEVKSYKPGGYLLANRVKDKDACDRRIYHLLNKFLENLDTMIEKNIITIIDKKTMKSAVQAYVENNGKDIYGNELEPDDVYLMDRGHKTPHAKGGSNQDIALQDSYPNRSDGDRVTHS